ncbi:MAG: nuclear transport factor 2 family protein [Bacteroidia bacterium]
MKTIYLLMVILLGIAGCKTDAMQELRNKQDANVQLIQAMFAEFNRHQWEAMAEYYAEESHVKSPETGMQEQQISRDELIAIYRQLEADVPDIKDEVVNIYPAGERHIIAEFISTGTGADGMSFALPICAIFTINGGLITSDFTYYDNYCAQ